MGNSQISEVDHHKHLGVIFDRHMDWNKHIDYIVKKASKRVESMRRISHIVPRKSLVNLYKCLVQPILEYACVAFDNIDNTKSKLLENVQIQAAIVCTGGFRLTSHDKLLDELGWVPLEKRREMFRILLMHRIVSNQAPNYLQRLVPQMGPGRLRYTLRNDEELRIFHPRLTCFRESFFPKTTREWNAIGNDELKSCESHKIFKSIIRSMYLPKKSCKLFILGDVVTAKHMARMRMGLNHLNYYLHCIGVKDNPSCSLCNLNDIEDVIHFMLICPQFRCQRTELYKAINTIIPQETIDAMSDLHLCTNLLYGFSLYTTRKNTVILYYKVLKFVHDSKRFTDLINT